jgi:hypothetical protein
MHNVTTFLNYLANNWTTIALYLGAAGILPAAVILTEKLIIKIAEFITKEESVLTPIEKTALVYMWGVILALAHWIVLVKTNNPYIVFVQGAVLFVTSQPFYIKLYKPLKVWLAKRIEEATQLRKDAAAATVPPEGMPLQAATDKPFQG